MLNWKIINNYLLVLSCSIALTACSSQQKNVERTDNNKILKLLNWQAPTILNPHLSNGTKDYEASRITLEPLATFGPDEKIIPVLAAEIPSKENGTIARDGLSVTWKLKPNLKWSDGTPVTAADVVFTYSFIKNPQVGSISYGNYELVKSVEAIDDLTVKINFKQVNPAWFVPFVGNQGMIIPKHLFEAYNGVNAREARANIMAVGTGPYRVKDFKPADIVIYEPNPYFREVEKLAFERVELKGGGSATSAARAVLQTADADFAFNLQVEANVLEDLARSGRGKIVSKLGGSMERLMFNLSDPNRATTEGERSSIKFPHPFFSELKVRQAFSLAVDRESIATQLYGQAGKATNNFLVGPAQYYSKNTNYEFNLKKAASLLDEAGWRDRNGNGIRDKNGQEMQVLFQTSVNPLRQKTQEIIKQSLQSIGVGVELKTISPSVFFSGDPANKDTTQHFYADLQMFTRTNSSPDPSNYMKMMTCGEITQKFNNWSGTNYSRYCDRDYDRLWQQSSVELDPQTRTQLLITLNDKLISDVAMIPLIHRARVVGVSNNLKGVNLTAWDSRTWNIHQWEKTN